MPTETERSKTWWLWRGGSSPTETIIALVGCQRGQIQWSELEFYTHAWRLDERGEVIEAAGLPSELTNDGKPISVEDFAHLVAAGAVSPLGSGSPCSDTAT